MYARVATFEGDPADIDDAISHVRTEVESGQAPPELEDAKMLMLVDRQSGKGLAITLFDSEEAMQRCDEALSADTASAPSTSPPSPPVGIFADPPCAPNASTATAGTPTAP